MNIILFDWWLFFKNNFHFNVDNGICPPSLESFGGRCDCSNAPGWTETGGWAVKCDNVQCFGIQEYDWCVGKDDYHPVGDGTWCENDKRRTPCTIVKDRGKNDFTC